MKKLFFILLISCLLLSGCGKKEESNNIDGVSVEEIGMVKSDLGEDCLLLKATNNGKSPVTVFTTVTLLDESNKEVAEETGLVSLYSGQSNYYIVEISSANEYKTYKVKNESMLNMYADYKSVYDSTKLEKLTSDDKETIKFSIDNKTSKEIYAKVLGLFYKDNKIIAASVGNCELVKNKTHCEDSVYIPVNSMDDYTVIDYDKVDLLLMNVDYQ